jgi:molybdate transport system substrate-binding protein
MPPWQERLSSARAIAVVMVVLVLVVARLRSPKSSPNPAAPLPGVRVAAAADLRFALDEVVADYEKRQPQAAAPTVTYGSSGTMYAQILNGAPFDVFLSADVEYPRRLAEAGKVVSDSSFTYAIGRIVVWVPSASTLDVEREGLKAVADPSVKKLAIANPAHAPYGRAAEAALRAESLYDAVQGKLVLGENVSQALQFAQSGAADAGIVALSLALSPNVRNEGRYRLIPESLYPRLEQAGVILKTDRIDQARNLRNFLVGQEARDTLKRYGFSVSGS